MATALSFDSFEFDLERFELRRDGQRVPMEPKVFDLLALLIEQRDRVVTKAELLERVWGHRFVSESALTTQIKVVRQALGDDGTTQRYIQTVRGRGYRFVGDTESPTGTATILLTDIEGATGRDPFPAVRTGERAADNLPVRRGELLGRGDDVERVLDALRTSRLVTLTGIGGTGKTSLALVCATELVDKFADGVWFVDLIPVSSGDRLVLKVAEANGLLLSVGTAEELATLLHSRQTLLVFDNCEHLIDDVADLVDALLQATETPRFLATSREPLKLLDEQVIAVPPLATDEGNDSAATDLFCARAERVGAVVSDDELAVVASICRHLDGLPLAIELAAGQLAHMTVRELEQRLDQRFELLTGAARGRRQTRHASLEAVLTETWNQLSNAEQELLKFLTVFPGTFDLSAVEARSDSLSGSVPAVSLRGLVHRALVAATTEGDDSSYRLLETVKLFAQREASDDERHRYRDDHLHRLVSHINSLSLEDRYTHLGFVEWYHRYYEDLRVAAEHALDIDRVYDAVQIVAAGGPAWYLFTDVRCLDGLNRIDRLLAHEGLSSLDQARLRLAGALASMGARNAKRLASDAALALEQAEAADEPAVLARALTVSSWSIGLSDPDAALEMLHRAQRIALESGLREIAGDAGAYVPVSLALAGRMPAAITALEEQMAIGYAEDRLAYLSLAGLGSAVAILDRPKLAAALMNDWLGKSLQLDRPLPWNHYVTREFNDVTLEQVQAAAVALETAQQRAKLTGSDDGLPDLLIPIALAAFYQHDHERSAHLLGAVRAASRPTQSFAPTLIYHRLRREVGLPPRDVDLSDTIGIYEDALEWLKASEPHG